MTTVQDRQSPASGPPATGRLKWLPGLRTLLSYKPAWLPRDLVAGLVLTALLVPAGMGYAEASGLPPINGLYATIVPLTAYAVFGPEPDPGPRPGLVAGPADRGRDRPPGRRRPGAGGRAGRDAQARREYEQEQQRLTKELNHYRNALAAVGQSGDPASAEELQAKVAESSAPSRGSRHGRPTFAPAMCMPSATPALSVNTW
jgi:sulfate permease family protein